MNVQLNLSFDKIQTALLNYNTENNGEMIEQNFKCPEKFDGLKRFGESFSFPLILVFEEGPKNIMNFNGPNHSYAKTDICLSAFEGENGEIMAGKILLQ